MINYDDLEMALFFSTSGEALGDAAYVDSESGHVYFVSDVVDEEYPNDIAENEKYIMVPPKKELGLGKSLAIEFAEEFLPGKIERVHKIFSSRGAYSAFKEVLQGDGLLDKWYEYEQDATGKALLQWAEEAGLEVSG